MAQRFARDPAKNGVGYPVIGVNSQAFALADAVYINSSGFLDVVDSADVPILGFSLDARTMASDNQTVAKVKPQYVYAEGVEMVYPKNSSTGVDQTDVGEYCNLATFTTGAQDLANASSGTTGQFLIMGFDPDNDGTTTDAVVKVAFDQKRSNKVI